MLRLCKAEFIKYAHEIRCYYPDQLVGIIVTVIMFALFLLLNGSRTESAFIGFVYWYLLSSVISEAAVSISAEKQMGILDQLIIKPFPFEWLILARTFSWLIVNLLKVVVVSCILSVLLRVPLSFHHLVRAFILYRCNSSRRTDAGMGDVSGCGSSHHQGYRNDTLSRTGWCGYGF